MNVEMNPWLVAILIESVFVGVGAAVFFYYRVASLAAEYEVKLGLARDDVEDARAEARRIEDEALRKRKIVTFEDTDIEGLKTAGEMAGDGEVLDGLKTKVSETSGVLSVMTVAVGEVSNKLSETMDKQMEAVSMVGRLGGTGGLPPEVKEKAEAILDVFRTMDEILSAAYEEVDKIESGLGEVGAVVSEFTEADPKVKLPSAEILNALLKRKTGGDDSDAAPSTDGEAEAEAASAEEVSAEAESPDEPPMDAFDGVEEQPEEIRV